MIRRRALPLAGSVAAVSFLALLLHACGGGDAKLPTEPPPPPVLGTISGQVTVGGTGLQGVVVSLSNGASTSTDSGGRYSFSNLAAGTYTVTISGFGVEVRFATTSQTATISAGSTAATVNFAGEPSPGTLVGTVFRDTNADGVRQAGEAAQGGIPIGVVGALALTTSNAQGAFAMNLSAGVHVIVVTPKDGLIGNPRLLDTLKVTIRAGQQTRVDVPVVEGAQGEVSSGAGGSVSGPGGVRLTVPAGALGTNATVSIVREEVTVDGRTVPAVSISTGGAQLVKPVVISFPDDPTGVGPGASLASGGVRQIWRRVSIGGVLEDLWTPTTSLGGRVLGSLKSTVGRLWVGVESGAADFIAFSPLPSGTHDYAILGTPTNLASGVSHDHVKEDIERAFKTWESALALKNIRLVRNDASASPRLKVKAADLGPCGTLGEIGLFDGIARSKTVYLNNQCQWYTARDPRGVAVVQGVMVHEVGHLLGLRHWDHLACDHGQGVGDCENPPTLASLGGRDIGPLWPEDWQLFATAYGLGSDIGDYGAARIEMDPAWTNGVVAPPGTRLPKTPAVRVLDRRGRGIKNVTVMFRPRGGGTLENLLAVTDSSGVATPGAWTLGTANGLNEVVASFLYHPTDDFNGGVYLQRNLAHKASVTLTATAGTPPVATVTLSPASATLAPNQTVQLTATLKDAAGNTLTGRTVTWSSSATNVATVNSTGLVTAVAAGSATITATSEGKSGSAVIVVAASSGGIVLVNDLNIFDNTRMTTAGNTQLVRNLLSVAIVVGPRNMGSRVWFDTGRSSYPCSNDQSYCPSTGANMSTIRQVIASATSASGRAFAIEYVESSVANRLLEAIPSDVRTLFLWNPYQTFTPAEVSSLKAFVGSGGTLVFVGERGAYYGTRSVSGVTGAQVQDQFLAAIGSSSRYGGGDFDTNPTTTSLGSHPVLSGVSAIRTGTAASINLGAGDTVLFRSDRGSEVLGAFVVIRGG